MCEKIARRDLRGDCQVTGSSTLMASIKSGFHRLKIIYLDQLHWIEIAKHINGKPTKEGTDEALNHILGLSKKDIAIFPLSISHYYETLKQSDPGRRQRLAQVINRPKIVAIK